MWQAGSHSDGHSLSNFVSFNPLRLLRPGPTRNQPSEDKGKPWQHDMMHNINTIVIFPMVHCADMYILTKPSAIPSLLLLYFNVLRQPVFPPAYPPC